MKRYIHAATDDWYDEDEEMLEDEDLDEIELLQTKISILEAEIERGDYTDEDELFDAKEQLEELRQELNFAYQDDEASWQYAKDQQEFNPDGSLRSYPGR